MSLGVLGAASGSAGLILEHYWSFLTSLFSFAEEALAFGCLPNFWTLLCSHKRLQFSFNRERRYPAPQSDFHFELLLVP
jgi:hypothetical protein